MVWGIGTQTWCDINFNNLLRLGQLPCKSMLPATAANYKHLHGFIIIFCTKNSIATREWKIAMIEEESEDEKTRFLQPKKVYFKLLSRHQTASQLNFLKCIT